MTPDPLVPRPVSPTTGATVPPASVTPLREVVEQRLGLRWEEWSREHPNRARAIDRTKLVDSAVSRIRHDPEFVAALREADLDEARLAAAARVLALVERLVSRAMSL
jgi:hypothetical protein